MKNLLKLLTVLTITTPVIATSVACGNGNSNPSQSSLTTITQLTGLGIKVDVTKTFHDLDVQIAAANEFKTTPLAAGYNMQYFNAGGDVITGEQQAVGTFYVQITAALSDPNWQGVSNQLLFAVKENNAENLNTITSLSLDEVVANFNNTFLALNAKIATAQEFAANPLAAGYEMNYYSDTTSSSNINTKLQPASGGTFYVEIIAALNDPNWYGQTNRLQFTLVANPTGKTDLNGLQNATVTSVTQGDVSGFTTALITQLQMQSGFNSLTAADVTVTEGGGSTPLTAADIATNAALAVRVTALPSSLLYIGDKDLSVNLTTVSPTDLGGLGNATVTGVTQGDISGFTTALVTQLQMQSGFGALTVGDVNVTEGGGSTPLTTADITTNAALAVRVAAQTTSTNFTGQKDISVNLTTQAKTDLGGLGNATVTGVTQGDVSGFTTALVNQLKTQSGFGALTTADVTVTEAGGSTPLTAADITTDANLPVRVTAQATSTNFTGQKDISVNLSTLIDLGGLANATVTGVLQGDVNGFTTALITQLKMQSGFSTLTAADVNVTEGGGSTPLTNADITTNAALAVRVAAQATSTNFTGQKDLSVNLTTAAKTDLSTISTLTVNYTVDSSKPWNDLDTAVQNASEFGAHPLSGNPTINFYASSGSTTPINTNLQNQVSVYVVISADPTDANWSGTTGYIQMSITPNFIAMNGDSDFTTTMAIDKDGNVYASGDNNGTVYKFPAGGSSFALMTGTPAGPVRSITCDPVGNIYLGTVNGVVMEALAGSNEFTIQFTNAPTSVSSIKSDSAGNIYVGGGQGEILKALAGSSDFTVSYTTNLTTNQLVTGLLIDSAGDIYAGISSGSLSRGISMCPNNSTTFTAALGIDTSYNYRGMALDNNGNVYVSGVGGASGIIYQAVAGTNNFTQLTSFTGDAVYGLVFDENNNLYVATTSGIFRLLNGGTTFYERFIVDDFFQFQAIVYNQANQTFYAGGVNGSAGAIYQGN